MLQPFRVAGRRPIRRRPFRFAEEACSRVCTEVPAPLTRLRTTAEPLVPSAERLRECVRALRLGGVATAPSHEQRSRTPLSSTILWRELSDDIMDCAAAAEVAELWRRCSCTPLEDMEIPLLATAARLSLGSATSRSSSDNADTCDSIFLILLKHSDPALSVREASILSSTTTVFHDAAARCSGAEAFPGVAVTTEGNPHYVRLASLCVSNAVCATAQVVSELRKGGRPLPLSVFVSLLSLPASPRVLEALVEYAADVFVASPEQILRQPLPLPDGTTTRCRGFFDCTTATMLWLALLRSDTFFRSEREFSVLDGLMHRILAIVAPGADVNAALWSPTLNKLSRVYQKQRQGHRLAIFHATLLKAIPQVAVKMPLPYFVRCIGSLIDAGCAEDAGEESSLRIWREIVEIAQLAACLHCHNATHRRDLWAVLLKAALVLYPLHNDYSRLLDAYQCMARSGSPMEVDKAAFHQLTRLLGYALACSRHRPKRDGGGLEPPLAETPMEIVRRLVAFLLETPSISFLWTVDSVAVILRCIWEGHGEAGRDAAHLLVDEITRRVFPARRVVGVHLADNNLIRHLLEEFGVAERSPFWWTCGCGCRCPAAAKRCNQCMRRGRINWTCTACHREHRDAEQRASSPPSAVSSDVLCDCGEPHPRCAASLASSTPLCSQCGSLTSSKNDDGVASTVAPRPLCDACSPTSLAQREKPMRACQVCGAGYADNDVCCPRCFERNPESEIFLWHCAECQQYTYSSWSKCQRCPRQERPSRKVGCHIMAFAPWVCGCGARNHPGRLMCMKCSADPNSVAIGGESSFSEPVRRLTAERNGSDASPKQVFRCSGCGKMSRLRFQLLRGVASSDLRICHCEFCGRIHPRDSISLDSPALEHHCATCGHKFAKSNCDRNAPDAGSKLPVCPRCSHTLPCNELHPFTCSSSRCRPCGDGRNTHLWQTGYACTHCGTLRREVCPEQVFVWRCLREMDDQAGLCGAWNESWKSSCRLCGGSRAMNDVDSCARYMPWNCSSCSADNAAVDVLFCPHCENGLQLAPTCTRCGEPHLSASCPSVLQVLAAQRLARHLVPL